MVCCLQSGVDLGHDTVSKLLWKTNKTQKVNVEDSSKDVKNHEIHFFVVFGLFVNFHNEHVLFSVAFRGHLFSDSLEKCSGIKM